MLTTLRSMRVGPRHRLYPLRLRILMLEGPQVLSHLLERYLPTTVLTEEARHRGPED
jgi:hypothetical protein